jgi:protein-tyrosine phosphatase
MLDSIKALVLLGVCTVLLACAQEPDLAPADSERVIDLDGASNFRSLGGYPGDEGRITRVDTLYRSGLLTELSRSDLDRLSELGVKTIIDLRSEEEREAHPSRVPAGAETRVIPLTDEGANTRAIAQRIMRGDSAGLDLPNLLVESNQRLATQFNTEVAEIISILADPARLPAVFHCSAGKDRTGYIAAVVLMLLGVDEATVFEDYLLSNQTLAAEIDSNLFKIRLMSLFRADQEGMREVMSVRRRYLNAALVTIDQQYGGFDAYREQVLGMDEDALRAFRDLHLSSKQQ